MPRNTRLGRLLGIGLAAWAGAAGALAQVSETEWHFNGDLFEVGGPSRLRFLDDPTFGNPPNGGPTGQTALFGQFGTTDGFRLPPIGGETVPVFRMPPPRDPTTGEANRGIGLVLWPSNRVNHPDGLVVRWTIVMDLLIPAASYGPGIIIPLINYDDNNGDDADLFIAGPSPQISPPVCRVGPRSQWLPAGQIQADTWFRLVLVVDNAPGPTSGSTTRIFINGDFIGQVSSAGSLFNMVDPEAPTYADGTLVPSLLWARWGEFPSPWATGPGGGLLSTATIFSDNDGEGRPFYVAKAYMTDTDIDDTQASGLDEPGPDRIILCEADLNADHTVDVFDLLIFLDEWFSGDPYADINNDNSIDVFDLLLFLDQWFAPCP